MPLEIINVFVFFLSFFPDLNMEFNPSDHPRASTIFLSKSQTDGRLLNLLQYLLLQLSLTPLLEYMGLSFNI